LIIFGLPVQAGNPGWTPSCASMSNPVLASMQRGPNTAMHLSRRHKVILFAEHTLRPGDGGR